MAILNHLLIERNHCTSTKINKVRIKGKAGYRVLKFSGGHGDHEISLPLASLGGETFFNFLGSDIFVANPLLIKTYIKAK